MSEKCKSLAKEYESYLSETFNTFTELKKLTDEEIRGATNGTVFLALVNQSLLTLKTQELLLEMLIRIDEIGDKINAMEDSLEKQEPTQETKTEAEE